MDDLHSVMSLNASPCTYSLYKKNTQDAVSLDGIEGPPARLEVKSFIKGKLI